jgi:hypothetical protein
MRGSALAPVAAFTVLLVAACQIQEPSSSQLSGNDLSPVPGAPTASANMNCSYTPAGPAVEIQVGQTGTFFPNNVSDCTGAYGVLTPTDHRVGFQVNLQCNLFGTTAAKFARFTVRRCEEGLATLNIYTNSNKTTLLQTITISHN